MSNKTESRFFFGVLVLSAGNLLVKILGLALKVPLRNLMGDGGMAYYNNAYDIYSALFMIATSGLPSAISILVPECNVKGKRKEAVRVYRIAFLIFFALGLVGSAIMLLGAPLFEAAYKITNLRYTIMAIGPTMLFICVASAFRGYFQSYQYMLPTSVSEIIESVGKFALGIVFGKYAADKGYPVYIVAAYAAIGITAGVLLGMIYLWFTKLLFRTEKYNPYLEVEEDTLVRKRLEIALAILAIAIPISLSSSVTGLEAVIDGMLLSRRIQASGFAEEVSNALIGNYRTCAVPLYNLPLAFVGPIGASVIPVLAAAIAEKDKKRENDLTDGSIILLGLIMLPCAFGLGFLSSPIIQLLFGSGKGAETAAPLLTLLCVALFGMGLVSLTGTLLHTYKMMKEPLLSVLLATCVKILAVFILAGIKEVNIYAGPLSTILFAVTAVTSNLIFMKKKIGYSPKGILGVLVRIIASSLLCGVVAFGTYFLLDRVAGLKIATVIAIIVAIPIYVVAAVLLRTFRRREILLLPKGEKIARLMDKFHLIKE